MWIFEANEDSLPPDDSILAIILVYFELLNLNSSVLNEHALRTWLLSPNQYYRQRDTQISHP